MKLSMLKCWNVSAGGTIQVLKERQKADSHYDVVTIFFFQSSNMEEDTLRLRRDSVGYWSVNTYGEKNKNKGQK